MVRAAWPLGDRAVLDVFALAFARIRKTYDRQPGWDKLPADIFASEQRPEHASEWARELDFSRTEGESFTFDGLPGGYVLYPPRPVPLPELATYCAHDAQQCGYAFGLALLTLERDAAEYAVHRMLSTAIALDVETFFAGHPTPSAEMRAGAFAAASLWFRNELRRQWPQIKARAGRPATCECGLVYHAEQTTCPHEKARRVNSYSPFPVSTAGKYLERLNGIAETIEDAKARIWAARLRGWMPEIHGEIPREAFEPFPSEQEAES